ncbi:MAG: hypothetical protein JWR55_2575 [Aeromicrobium sp.]|nr:hypothetical protein [Aeromicrobium sp.]
MHYFTRRSATRYEATDHTGGGWNPTEQHIAPVLGLMVHAIECDGARRRSEPLAIARLTFDILGTLPIGEVETSVTTVRPGRTIELVEVTLSHAGRSAAVLRAWLLQAFDSEQLAGTSFPSIAPAESMAPFDATAMWPGGFVASVEVRRDETEPGSASWWTRTPVSLVADEPVSATARAVGLFDLANGITPRVTPEVAFYPNTDLTAHLFRQPSGEWLGFSTSVSYGPRGAGVTHSVLHDELGPFGTLAQMLTVRPKPLVPVTAGR